MLLRQPAPVHVPTVENFVTSPDASHEAASHDHHYGSPTHHVHVSSPTHSVSSASESSTSDSQCTTHTQATEDDTGSSEDEELTVMGETEKPFSWENLSEVEDKETAELAMAEPEEVQFSPQQFSALISEVSTEQSPSLQEAFRQHRPDFISNSQSRLRQVKEKSKQRLTTSADHQQQLQHHKTPFHGVSGNVATPKDSSSRVVQFSSPLITLQDTGVFTPPTIHRPNSMCVYSLVTV